MHETSFDTPFGAFDLHRQPHLPNLKAWDGADHYLLELAAAETQATALIVNDSFGALSCALHRCNPISWSDSYTTHAASRANFVRNHLDGKLTTLPSTELPVACDLVLWRVPKSLQLFEQQIARLQPLLRPDSVVLVGGMDKHLLPNTKELLARLGTVTTLPGKKKSHVFRVQPDPTLPPAPIPREAVVRDLGLTLRADTAVFAREKIDIGARFFIAQLGHLPPAQRIADLGCGNGILSLVIARQYPQADIHLFDESYQAIASARANWAENIGEPDPGRFHIGDGLDGDAEDRRGEPFDLILCNPPFHQQHVIGDHIARQMFAQSRAALRRGGELWVVGNRHLDYHIALRRLFGNCRQIATNPKFVVLAARA